MQDKIQFTEGSGINIAAHSFTEDSITKKVERVAPGTGVLTMPSAQIPATNTLGVYPESPINITGKGRIIIKSTLSISGERSQIKLQLFDSNGTIFAETDAYELIASDALDGTRYIGSVLTLKNDDLGASGVKVRLTSAPATGSIEFTIAGL